MRFRSRVAATAATLPLILGLAACGAEKTAITATDNAGSTPTPASTPTPVSTTTAPLKVAPAADHLTTATFLPAMKKATAGKNSVRMSMKMVIGDQSTAMTGVQTMKPAAARLDMNGPAVGGKAKMIIAKGMIYLSTPDLPAGKYVKVDPTDSSDPVAAGLGDVAGEMDPTKTFDALEGGLSDVEFIRIETVDGSKMARYKVTVDSAGALKAQGKKMIAGMPKTIIYSIWADSSHLMRKVAFKIPGASVTMTSSDWGKPVTIKAPPASSIIKR